MQSMRGARLVDSAAPSRVHASTGGTGGDDDIEGWGDYDAEDVDPISGDDVLDSKQELPWATTEDDEVQNFEPTWPYGKQKYRSSINSAS